MSLYNPCPLPLLLPKVDLTRTATLGSTSITPGLYRSLYHALGVRKSSTSLYNSSYKPVVTPSGLVSFLYAGTMAYGYGNNNAANVTGITATSSSAPIVHGSIRGSQSIGPADWITHNSGTITCQFTLGTTTYSNVYLASIDSLFAGYEYYKCAYDCLSSNAGIYFPWNLNHLGPFSPTVNPTSDWFDKLPIYALPQDAANQIRFIGYAPSRPLRSTPVLVEEERVNQLVSLSGRSYRRSYSRRRIYEVNLLLDGAKAPPISTGYDPGHPMDTWHDFLKWADAGVTLWIDRDWPSLFWRPDRAIVCPGMPNEISGALLEASSLRFAPRDGIPDAYEVTLLIADETGCVPYIGGSMPTWL